MADDNGGAKPAEDAGGAVEAAGVLSATGATGAQAAAVAADIADEELLIAPERGSVDELLDAGAHDELDAMRHSTAHVMAEAVLALFPGTQLGIGPAIKDGVYYDFK